MRRRSFLKAGITGAMAARLPETTSASPADSAEQSSSPPLYQRLPRWRGFNLREKLDSKLIGRNYGDPMPGNQPFREQDFEWTAEWGFDFVRLPMDYHCWAGPDDPCQFDEKTLKDIDKAVEWGSQYGIHVSLNMHHAPGYRVEVVHEESLWTHEKPQKLFNYYWAEFARRYRGIPAERLSFNLVNEPARITPTKYITQEMCAKVCLQAIEVIHKIDPDRLVIADGLNWAKSPLLGLVGARAAQSTHWYEPRHLTHYNAPFLPKRNWPEPAWPLQLSGRRRLRDKDWLRDTLVKPWKKLQSQGVGVHVGEWGILDTVPHEIALRWTRDCLELLKEAGWGWALWNIRGERGYGFLDTHRKDVQYEDFHGHRLDRKMLELLQEI